MGVGEDRALGGEGTKAWVGGGIGRKGRLWRGRGRREGEGGGKGRMGRGEVNDRCAAKQNGSNMKAKHL